ncbi:MAG: ribonuclease P protein component [Desulfitobacteriaceae bacterium]
MLPISLRLRKKLEYKTVFASGKSYPGRYTVLIILKGPTKIGFIASKKVGNSVVRNRARRLMREVIRLHMSDLVQDVQIILIARSTIKGASYSEVEKAILQTLQKAKLFAKKM